MPEPRSRFPPAEQAASAQLAPYRLRFLAFALDASMLILVLIVGGLASVLSQYALDFGVSTLSIVLLAVAVFIGFGVMNATLAYLTDGQTVGKAFCGLIERRRADGPDLGESSGLGRLMGRHTVGYLVIDVFGLGALASFRLARRRCLHDVAFDTEVVFVGGDEDRVQRVKALDERRKTRLAEMREQWGWAYHLVKWASGLVIAFVGGVVTVLKAVGLLSSQATPASTAAVGTAPAAAAPSAAGVAGLVGVTAAATIAVPVVGNTLGTSNYACNVLRGMDLQSVAIAAFPESQRLTVVQSNAESYPDRNYSGCQAVGQPNQVPLAGPFQLYVDSPPAGDYTSFDPRFYAQDPDDPLEGTTLVELIDLNDPRVDSGLVVLSEVDELYGVQDVRLVLVGGGMGVIFVGPLDAPADWQTLVDELLMEL